MREPQRGGSLLHDEGTGCREFGLGAVEPAAKFLDALAEFDGTIIVDPEATSTTCRSLCLRM